MRGSHIPSLPLYSEDTKAPAGGQIAGEIPVTEIQAQGWGLNCSLEFISCSPTPNGWCLETGPLGGKCSYVSS